MKLFTTLEHQCPYFSDRQATNMIVDPNFLMQEDVYSHLINLGFRRSGKQVYRPHCLGCNACIATRILVNQFKPTRSQRRNWKKNQDIEIKENNTKFSDEYANLYTRYLQHRHAEDDIASDEVEHFASFVFTAWCKSQFLEYRLNGKLLGVAVTDILTEGLSAVYTFFEPDEGSKRGLGIYSILYQIEKAKQMQLSYVYPGYWLKNCQKMSYKTRFKPIEGLINETWQRL